MEKYQMYYWKFAFLLWIITLFLSVLHRVLPFQPFEHDASRNARPINDLKHTTSSITTDLHRLITQTMNDSRANNTRLSLILSYNIGPLSRCMQLPDPCLEILIYLFAHPTRTNNINRWLSSRLFLHPYIWWNKACLRKRLISPEVRSCLRD